MLITNRSRKRSKLRVNPNLSNHSTYKNLRAQWRRQTPLKDLEALNTRDFFPKDFFKPLELASFENLSISCASMYFRALSQEIPSSETILDICHIEGEENMEIYLNHELEQQFLRLPSKIRRNFKRRGMIIIDFHTDPYYGERDNPNVVTMKKKHGTNKGYSYLTADLYSPKGCQTIALVQRKPGVAIETLFGDLLARIELILTPKLILMDGEFVAVKVLESLFEKRIPWIGRKSMTQRLQPLALAYKLTDNWKEQRQFTAIELLAKDKRTSTTIHVTFQQTYEELKALAISPLLRITPDVAEAYYSLRFNIETGYRDKHLFQARTTAKTMDVRFFILLFAIVLWNLWQAFLIIAASKNPQTLDRIAKWRRQARVIKLFELRDYCL